MFHLQSTEYLLRSRQTVWCTCRAGTEFCKLPIGQPHLPERLSNEATLPAPRCVCVCVSFQLKSFIHLPAQRNLAAPTDIMEVSTNITRTLPRLTPRLSATARHGSHTSAALASSPMAVWSRRQFTTHPRLSLPGPTSLGFGGSSSSPTYFQRQTSLPANTVIRFVPQQTAWIVERMGKFNRILEPGLAILVPVLDVGRFRTLFRVEESS